MFFKIQSSRTKHEWPSYYVGKIMSDTIATFNCLSVSSFTFLSWIQGGLTYDEGSRIQSDLQSQLYSVLCVWCAIWTYWHSTFLRNMLIFWYVIWYSLNKYLSQKFWYTLIFISILTLPWAEGYNLTFNLTWSELLQSTLYCPVEHLW